MPFSHKKIKTNIPIFVIQGSIEHRRNSKLLVNILSNNYDYNFIIKIICKSEKIPDCLSIYKDKIQLKSNLDFIDFHTEFLDCYCILPLISKNTHNQYYTTKLTSSINYAKGYDLKCLIDKDLQDIYKLKNSYVHNNENDIVSVFNKALIDYNN